MSVLLKKNVINLGFKVLLQLAPGLLSNIGMGGYISPFPVVPNLSQEYGGPILG